MWSWRSGCRNDRARAGCALADTVLWCSKEFNNTALKGGFCKTKHDFINEIKASLPVYADPGAGVPPSDGIGKNHPMSSLRGAQRRSNPSFARGLGSPRPLAGARDDGGGGARVRLKASCVSSPAPVNGSA